MSSKPAIKNRYYPRLSSVISENDIPDILGFIKTGVVNLLDNIYFKDLQYNKSPQGDSAFYGLSIVSPQRIDIEIPGTGIFLVLNPDLTGDNKISAFPITIEYQWKILAYLRSFSVGNFSFDPQQIFEVALRVLNVSEEQAIAQFINSFVEPVDQDISSLKQFINDLNELYPDWNLPEPNNETTLSEVVQNIFEKSGKYASLVAFSAYLLTDDIQETSTKVKVFFRSLIPQDIDEFIKDVIIPKFRATLLLSAAIEFPRSILIPVNREGTVSNEGDDISFDPIPDQKVILSFAEALFYADTQKGFGYNLDLVLNTNYPAQIGNTGLIIDIRNMKIDLSKSENIAEADADGRPKDFMGVYMEYTEIFLPKKWFKKNPGQTIGISANNLLVGTGGVSGNITIAATYKTKVENGITKVESYYKEYFNIDYSNFKVFSIDNLTPVKVNSHDELVQFINNLNRPSDLKFQFPITITPIGQDAKKINTEREYLSFLKNLPPVFSGTGFESNFLWFKLGDHTKYPDKPENKKKFWSLGFQKFIIDFHHGKVIHSSLHAALKIEKFKKLNDNGQLSVLYVDIIGEWENSENFKLSAGFLPDGLKIQLYDNVILSLQSAELGKKDNNFFIGADTKISFPANSIMGKLVKSTEIDLPAIRIYSNGRFEITGGIGFIPVNFTLPLGPVQMSVSGLHLGSIQKELNGVMRNYNYIGFDGGLSIDPIGVDIKGNGVKYYYTTDDDDFGDGDNYLHISTLEIDLIIPGTASETDAIVVIRGSLTLPEPGVSEEYGGSVMIKLPKAKIAGEAAMRLNPKNKSFLVKAAVEFPSPIIPLGPVGIYGFAGLIGKKYVADKKVVFPTNSDQKTWYDYYMAPKQGVDVDKFRDPTQTADYSNPFSIGIGASLATMADGGRTMSLRAMFLLSMPSMFAIDAGLSILSDRLMLTDKRIPPFYAFLIIGDDSLEFGAGANYQLNKTNGWFIDIKAEVQMGFFFKNQRPWYINFGTKEKPITATLFKDILNIKAESFLMISAAGIEAGAKVAFDFDLIIARAWVMVEVGTKISFERPQIGGYIYIEGGFSLNFAIIKVSLAVSIFFSVELVKPFLIFAQLRVQFSLKIGWKWFSIKIKFNVLLTFKWEKSKKVDLDAIAPLTFATVTDSDYPKQVTTDKNVKGIHMLTNESFDLKFLNLNTMPSTSVSIEDTYIIPLDTFIDIKLEKGLSPSQLVDAVIGSHTGMANDYIELIPPNEMARGGLTLRQVKHKYSIEDISIKIAVGRNWLEYKPYEVLFPDEKAGTSNLTSDLKIGHWQRNGDRYDTIRLLATSPFTYMDSGEPGWVNPEQLGITPSSLFCLQQETKWNFSNFLNIPLGTEYKPPVGYNAYLISGAYYNIDGTYSQTLEIDEDGNTIQVISDDKMVVRNTPNPFNYARSLEFSNGDNLVITFLESAVKIKLKLTTYSKGVKIECYKKVSSNPSQPAYKLISTIPYTKSELADIISIGDPDKHTSEGETPPVFSMIKIIPEANNKDRIEEINQEIAAIWAEATANAGEGATSIILTRLQRANLSRLEKELGVLKSKACSEITCKNLNFEILASNYDGQLEDSFSKIINNQTELSELTERINNSLYIPDIDFENHSVIVLYASYPIFIPYVIKLIKTTSSIKIQLEDSGLVFRPTGERYIIIKTEKIKDLQIIITEDECYCSDNPCNRQDVLCDYFDNLKEIMANCVDYSLSFVENIDCFNNFYTLISDFDHRYPQYAIGDSFDFPDEWDYDPTKPPSIDEALEEAFGIIAMIKREKGDCGCTGSDGGVTETVCTTSLQEISWKTIKEYEYEQTIPGIDAIQENAQTTMAAFSKSIQPIWRPNSKFLLHFRLKDEVVYNGNNDTSKTFDYYYGFRTMGPVGHFHKQKPDYLKYKDEKGNEKTYKAEEKAITSLRAYLDFNRSYPNPDGNLIGSKPLFYGHDQCRIDLFFDKPYVSHMFSDWPNFNGLELIKMDMPIAIKDPVSEAIIPYPLPEDWREEDVPGADYKWIDDQDPNLPLGIKTFINYWQSTNTNPENTRCRIELGDAIVPNVKMRSAILTNLMPEKLYTAIVYSAYDANGDGKIENQMDNRRPPRIIYEESQPIHEFGFITSRYANFREQVTSYLISDIADQDQITESKKSVYNLFVDLSTSQINNLYALIIGKPNAETELLRNQYIHQFDRAWEGVLKMHLLPPPSRTEFVKIMNSSLKNEVVAILIRNPEPFNDPRIPLEYIYDRINELGFLEDGVLKVLGIKGAGLKYKILWNKDFSQALIMHENKKIEAQELQFQFIYKTWDGNQRKYVVKNEDEIDQDAKLNTVITDPITIN